MTRDEILAMPAGMEMNALVAEKVMGWHEHNGMWLDLDNRIWANPPGWSPSTNIATAWEVVQKHPYYFALYRTNETDWRLALFGTVHWECRFYAPEKFDAKADTAPLAICRAALIVVLEREKGEG